MKEPDCIETIKSIRNRERAREDAAVEKALHQVAREVTGALIEGPVTLELVLTRSFYLRKNSNDSLTLQRGDVSVRLKVLRGDEGMRLHGQP